MVEPRFRWLFPSPLEVDPATEAIARDLGISPRVSELLHRRGVTASELAGFVGAPGDGLLDPWLLPDAAIFATRIGRARTSGERVMVFGDFDADGLTGLATVCRNLRPPRNRGPVLRPEPTR